MRVTDKRMLDAIKKNGGAVYLAARELGCAPNTIYNRMEKVPAMKQAVEDARGEVVDYAEQKLRLAVLNDGITIDDMLYHLIAAHLHFGGVPLVTVEKIGIRIDTMIQDQLTTHHYVRPRSTYIHIGTLYQRITSK